MQSAERLEQKLHSLDELHSIVRTMKALSAASIRQYEQSAEALGEYYRNVARGLYVAVRDVMPPMPAAPPRDDAGARAAVVFGSDHGLCGRFNETISEFALESLQTQEQNGASVRLAAVGERVVASLRHAGRKLDADFAVPASAASITILAQELLMQVDHWRETDGIEAVDLYYNRHAERASHEPTRKMLLPVDLARFQRLSEGAWPSKRIPQYSMGRRALLRRLLRQYLFVMIFLACAESEASEHASRLAAMQSAERSLDERLEDVRMSFRRARQHAITSELLDVVAGFEAITSAEDAPAADARED